MGRVELLVQANHDKCADWLGDIEKGARVDFSMGFDCKYDVCSKCGNEAKTRKDYCQCMKKSAGKILPDGRKVYVDNPEGVFNDISKVGTGADRIAQQLRKVAGLDGADIIGSADIADLLGVKNASDLSSKKALAEKISRMEKYVPVSSYKTEGTKRMEEKCASILRKANPDHMFGELVKCSVLLDIISFTKLVMGSGYSEMEAYAKEAALHTRFMFGDITENASRLESVCSNDAYDPNLKQANLLTSRDRTSLIQDFSIDPLFARHRLTKNAMFGIDISGATVSPISDPARVLLDEYAAYKLATLSSFANAEDLENVAEIDELIMFAIMSA